MATRFDWFITAGNGGIRNYLSTAFQENRGWDQVFRDILLADLSTDQGALDYLKSRVADTDKLANEVSVTFFGVNISCAKCHDHPLVADWTQDHFYGMKSFFSRTFENGGYVAERDYGLVSYQTVDGDQRQARLLFLTGKDVTPEDLSEPNEEERKKAEALFRELKKKEKAPPQPKYSLRRQLAELALEDGQNHFFARAIVNRVWHQLFGRGLVMPLDQMHTENPPSHPELLTWLADDFVAHGYDLRRLIRGLVLSRAYARGSRWEGSQRPPTELFAAAIPRPLTPTQLARSLSLATTDQSQLDCEVPNDLQQAVAEAAEARNADRFDQPEDGFQIAADEALYFTNSEEFEKQYLHAGLKQQLLNIEDRRQLADNAVWATLCRAADEEELQLLGDYLTEREDRREQAIEQLIWGLLTSSEFRFNH
jgi:hypothetical protein